MKMYLAPSIDEMSDGKLPRAGIRMIRIEVLLSRSEIKISMEEIKANIERKTILVTGVAGSIGSKRCRQLVQLGIKELIMYDNAETPLHNMRLEFEEKFPRSKIHPVYRRCAPTEMPRLRIKVFPLANSIPCRS